MERWEEKKGREMTQCVTAGVTAALLLLLLLGDGT